MPNDNSTLYSGYTVSCCEDCNSQMGIKIEEPVKNLIEQGFESVYKHIKENGSRLFFVWLSLIFIKTHLKDRSLRLNLDFREGNQNIASLYEWEKLHHVHCIARSFYTKAILDPTTQGSFLLIPAKEDNSSFESFDFRDMYETQSILIRIDGICFICILNDSCGALNIFMSNFKRLQGYFYPIQLREILGYMSYYNAFLKKRPKHVSEFKGGEYRIKSNCPKRAELEKLDTEVLGNIIYAAMDGVFEKCVDPKNQEEIKDKIKRCEYTFLCDKEGKAFLS